MPSVPTNLYDVLGVHPNASKDEIRRQYKRLALQYHPDKNIDGTPSEKQHAEVMFKLVSRAYEVLHDEARRRQYDLYGQEDDQQQAGGGGGGGAAASSSSSSGQHFRQSHPQHSHSSSSHRQQQEQQQRHSGDFPFDPFVSGMFGGMGGPSFFGHHHHHHHHPAFGGRGVRGGSGHPRHPFDMFSFTDPFELFERMMGREFGGVGSLPFTHAHQSHHQTAGRGGDHRSEPQHHHHAPSHRPPQQQQHSNNVGLHRMGGGGGVFDMFSQFDDMFASHASMFGNRGGVFGAHQHPAGMSFMTSSSSSNRSGGGGGVFESVSTVTEIRNGQRVTKTVRRSQDANGVVREHVDEEVADVAPSIHQQQYHRGVGGGRDAHRFLA